MKPPSLVTALGLALAFDVCAQVEVYLAYMKERPDSQVAWFPNDNLFQYMSKQPVVSRSEMLHAEPGYADGQAFIEIKIAPAARERLNKVVALNVANQDRGTFKEHIGLTFVVDREPQVVVQSVFQSLPDNRIWWHLQENKSRAEALKQANALAARINKREL